LGFGGSETVGDAALILCEDELASVLWKCKDRARHQGQENRTEMELLDVGYVLKEGRVKRRAGELMSSKMMKRL
jgi:hypothetical protein